MGAKIKHALDAKDPDADRRFSIRVFGLFGAVLIVITMTAISLSALDIDSFLPVFAGYMMLALWAGLIIGAIAQLVGLLTPGKWRPDVRAPWLLMAILMAGTTLPLFELFKQTILPMRGFPLDQPLAKIDRLLFFGNDAWRATHFLFGSVQATLLFDRAYAIWLPLMFLFPAVAVMATPDARVRARLLGCWLGSWIIIGSLGAWILGSAGPCYYEALVGPNPGFAEMNRHLAALASEAQGRGQSVAAVGFQSMLLNGRLDSQFVSAGGISAMPSMHVAMALLFAIAGFCVSRPIGWIMAIYAVTIWIASIHLGWHYAIDGIVGAGMMWGLWHLSGKMVGDDKQGSNPLPPSGPVR